MPAETYRVEEVENGFVIAWDVSNVGSIASIDRTKPQRNKSYLQSLVDALHKEPTNLMFLITLNVLRKHEYIVDEPLAQRHP
jgi:hypothetical protein